MNFSKDTLNIINKKIHDLEQLKNKNNFITTKEPVDIEKTFRITFKIIEDLKKMERCTQDQRPKKNIFTWMKKMNVIYAIINIMSFLNVNAVFLNVVQNVLIIFIF